MAGFISKDFADDLHEMLRWWRERGPQAGGRQRLQAQHAPEAFFTLSATTTTVISGVTYYSAATRVERTPGTTTWETKDSIYARNVNGAALGRSYRYLGTVTEFAGGRLVYETEGTSAKFIRFSLNSTLATTDASVSGIDVDGYWGGGDPDISTVYNLPASSNYIFSGASGANGLAAYDDVNNKYWIVQMECP